MASLGHESESTEGGSDLLYCLIKINLVCLMLRIEGWNEQWEIVKHLLLSHYWVGTVRGWKLTATAPWLCDSWHVELGEEKKKKWKGHQMRPVMQNRQMWLKDYEATVLTWRGNDCSHLKPNNPSCFTANARSNSLNPISCFHSIFNSTETVTLKKKNGKWGIVICN